MQWGNEEETVDKRLCFRTKMVILAGCSRMQAASYKRDGEIYVYNVKMLFYMRKEDFLR